jgi:hypothetical protein
MVYCKLCKYSFKTENKLQKHFSSEKHKFNLIKKENKLMQKEDVNIRELKDIENLTLTKNNMELFLDHLDNTKNINLLNVDLNASKYLNQQKKLIYNHKFHMLVETRRFEIEILDFSSQLTIKELNRNLKLYIQNYQNNTCVICFNNYKKNKFYYCNKCCFKHCKKCKKNIEDINIHNEYNLIITKYKCPNCSNIEIKSIVTL